MPEPWGQAYFVQLAGIPSPFTSANCLDVRKQMSVELSIPPLARLLFDGNHPLSIPLHGWA